MLPDPAATAAPTVTRPEGPPPMRSWHLLIVPAVLFTAAAVIHPEKRWVYALTAVAFTVSALAARHAGSSTPVRSPYGAPVRAIIAPAACGGFLLFIDYAQRQIAADVELGLREDEYEIPNAAEYAAADRGLADLGLTRTEPWRAEGRPGKFVASITNA